MKISIIGAGNVGTAIAAELALKHEVWVYTSKPEHFHGAITYIDKESGSEYISHIKKASNEYEEVVKGAEIIFIVLPSFLIRDTVQKITPYVESNTIIGFVPGAGGTEFVAKDLLDRGIGIFAFERVPYVARVVEYGKSVMASKKPIFRIAALPKKNVSDVAEKITELFEVPCETIKNYISITLTPTLHVSRLYGLYKDIGKDLRVNENPYFYREWRDEDSEICFALDQELHNVAQKLTIEGLDTTELRPYKVHYESKTPEELTQKLRSIKSLDQIKGPIITIDGNYYVELESRYFTESFPYRLALVKSYADIVGVEVPLINKVLEWYFRLSGETEFKNGSFIGNNNYNIPQNYGIYNLTDLKRLYGDEKWIR